MDQGTTDVLVQSNLLYAISKSPIRFHQAGENKIQSNTLGVKKGEKAFTFNSTDPKVIHFEKNREFPEGSDELKAAVDSLKHGN